MIVSIIIVIVGCAVFYVLPWYIQYPLMFLNAVIPDPVPFVDEIFMLYRFIQTSDKCTSEYEINGNFEYVCPRCNNNIIMEDLKYMSPKQVLVFIPFSISLLMNGHKIIGILLLIGFVYGLYEDSGYKKAAADLYLDEPSISDKAEKRKPFILGVYKCPECKAKYFVKSYRPGQLTGVNIKQN